MSTQRFSVDIGIINLGVQMQDECVVRIEVLAGDVSLPASGKTQRAIAAQLKTYAHSGEAALDFALQLHGTSFQCKVWRALQTIPAGEVKTYGELARCLHSSPRAVGNACRRNPVLLAVPCHRVVSASGLGGFAGHNEGRWPAIKRRLLAHEGVHYG